MRGVGNLSAVPHERSQRFTASPETTRPASMSARPSASAAVSASSSKSCKLAGSGFIGTSLARSVLLGGRGGEGARMFVLLSLRQKALDFELRRFAAFFPFDQRRAQRRQAGFL